MRLKEPLYGVRIASMHMVIHFSLLINMIIIDNKLWWSEADEEFMLRTVKEYNDMNDQFEEDEIDLGQDILLESDSLNLMQLKKQGRRGKRKL